MPVLLFAFALTALDLATYGLLFTAHAALIKGFSLADSAQVGGIQVFFRVVYLQVPLQIAALAFAFKKIRAPGYTVAILCAVVPMLAVAMVFLDTDLTSLWRVFAQNPLEWDLAEGIVLAVSLTVAWFVSAAIRPRQDQFASDSE